GARRPTRALGGRARARAATSNGERLAAGARALGVGIAETKAARHDAVFPIDFGADQEELALHIEEHAQAVEVEDQIALFLRVLGGHEIVEARAAAALHAQ